MKLPKSKSPPSDKNRSVPVLAIHCAHDELVGLSRLKPHPRNPNRHNAKQVALLAKILEAQGWRLPIVVSKRSGLIVAGHARLAAAQSLGVETGPVNYQQFDSDEQELAHLVADNKIAELADTDDATLRALIKDLGETDLDLDLLGLGDGLQAILDELNPAAPDDDHAADLADKAGELQKKWKTARGQVWELGDHRLMCGDSTSREDVGRLLGDDKPHLMVTDPPYGVEYDADWRNHALRTDGTPIAGCAVGKVHNDDKADWTPAWQLFSGDVAYVWHAGTKSHIVTVSLLSCDFDLRSMIVWAKNNFAIGRSHYHEQKELCLYLVRNGQTGHWNGDRSQTTLWQIDKPQKSETGHSTQKPVECMARPVRNNSKPGDLVYEPFSGSGTTLIACEQLHRRCRAMEIDPGYVAVALQRWSDLTGKTPTLLP